MTIAYAPKNAKFMSLKTNGSRMEPIQPMLTAPLFMSYQHAYLVSHLVNP